MLDVELSDEATPDPEFDSAYDDDETVEVSYVRWVNVALIGLPLLLFAVMAWHQRWNTEDAFINFRIVDQIFEGNGPVFNAGERVEAATSTTWIAGLVGLRAATLGQVDLEWLAVFLGLGMSACFLWWGIVGSSRLWGRRPSAYMVPAGLLVLVALPPMWDWATSGLETSMSFAWLAGCMALLAGLARRHYPGEPLPFLPLAVAAVAVGLGPLVRPDLGIFTVTLGIALLVLVGRRPKVLLGVAAAGLALPVLYEIFRMGYYAAVVPNTALAKSAGGSYWERGWAYALDDFGATYMFWVPTAVVLGIVGVLAWRLIQQRSPALWVVAAMEAGALIHIFYVIRIGGDYMHARMLLPAVVAFVLPAFVVRVSHEDLVAGRSIPELTVAGLAVLVLFPWAAYEATSVRIDSMEALQRRWSIQDERQFWADSTGNDNAVTLEDFRSLEFGWVLTADDIHGWDDEGRRFLYVAFDPRSATIDPDAPNVAAFSNVGVFGYAVGPNVQVVDQLGLADPIGSRLAVTERGAPGHEKSMPAEWVFARWSDGTMTDETVAAGYKALQCGELAELDEAVTADLTPGQFLSNMVSSLSLSKLSIPKDPAEAEVVFCTPQ